MDSEEVACRWSEYIAELFNDDRHEGEFDDLFEDNGAEILQSEIENAIDGMKRGKAAGEDGIFIEMIKASGDTVWKRMTKLVNLNYNTGHIPEQMSKSIFIAIPKIPGTLECNKHRTLSIMSQITKIILKVILCRIRNKIQFEVAEEQCGFVRGKGTSNTIFLLRVLSERMVEKQHDLYACFIDYEKAFDRVRHVELMEILKNIGVDGKDYRIIKELYFAQKACVRVNGTTTNYQKINQGVRQGCALSPDLFAIYGEIIMRGITFMEGVRVGGWNINNLRYADDTVLISDSEGQLQEMFNKVKTDSEEKGLNINAAKTKVMVFTKDQQPPNVVLMCNNKQAEQVNSFNYLGSTVTSDARCMKEIKKRINLAKQSFISMKPMLTNRKLSIKTRKRLIKTHVWSVLLYGAESWTISGTMKRRLEAIEMWLWRRMLRIPWTDLKTNEEVLTLAGETRNLMNIIRKRQLRFFGHVMRETV